MTTEQQNFPNTRALACSVFSLCCTAYEPLVRFEREISALVEKDHVRRFYVVAEYCVSGYVQLLEQLAKSVDIEIVGVISYTGISREWLEKQYPDYIPPFHRMENIDTGTKDPRLKTLRKIKTMLDRSDYCICDLSENPLAPNIKSYIQQLGRVTLIDFGEEAVPQEHFPA